MRKLIVGFIPQDRRIVMPDRPSSDKNGRTTMCVREPLGLSILRGPVKIQAYQIKVLYNSL